MSRLSQSTWAVTAVYGAPAVVMTIFFFGRPRDWPRWGHLWDSVVHLGTTLAVIVAGIVVLALLTWRRR